MSVWTYIINYLFNLHLLRKTKLIFDIKKITVAMYDRNIMVTYILYKQSVSWVCYLQPGLVGSQKLFWSQQAETYSPVGKFYKKICNVFVNITKIDFRAYTKQMKPIISRKITLCSRIKVCVTLHKVCPATCAACHCLSKKSFWQTLQLCCTSYIRSSKYLQ